MSLTETLEANLRFQACDVVKLVDLQLDNFFTGLNYHHIGLNCRTGCGGVSILVSSNNLFFLF